MTAVTIDALSVSAVGLAFAAGLLSFVSPCVLPLLPVYLSFISGVGVDRLGNERRRLLGAAVLFVLGFTVVFMLIGAGAGGVGRLLLRYRGDLTILAGVILVLSGIVLIADGLVHLPKPVVRLAPKHAGVAGAFVTGAVLAVAWVPCVGPVLGAILGMAASSQSARSGAFLLFVYSVGLGIPFLLAALAFDWMSRRLSFVKRHQRAVQVTAGVVLVVFGVLFAAGFMDQAGRWLPAFSPGGL